MPGTTSRQDIELIIEPVGGGGGPAAPPAGGDDSGGNGGKPRRRGQPSPNRYYTGIAVGIVSILMFFMALASAFLVRKSSSTNWVAVRIPPLLWLNTLILLASSGTIELARKRLANQNLAAFKKYWSLSTILGIMFLAGQFVVWRQLEAQGIYLASNPASSFFYIFTGAHALHLLGGVVALLYVATRNFDKAKVSRSVAAEVTSYYWHFLDALWIFLLLLLYVGR
jgi:cytochrome c oxidase subunit 3